MLNPDENGYLYAYIGNISPYNEYINFKPKCKIWIRPDSCGENLIWNKDIGFTKESVEEEFKSGIGLTKKDKEYDWLLQFLDKNALLFNRDHIKSNLNANGSIKYKVNENSINSCVIALKGKDKKPVAYADNNWDDLPNNTEMQNAIFNAIKSCPSYKEYNNFQRNEIIQRIQAKRNYDDDFIKNVLICIAQNFITVFAGQPGTGKTSLCDIIADVLDLNNHKRYRSVSVERGWNSKSELIGYYNAIGRKYEDSGSGLYHALKLLNNEKASDAAYPFFVLLDEANLSPVEHYWSAFMKLADESQLYDEGIRGEINIGDGQMYYVPDQLRFLATINNDQTTEPLSPRLLDRTSVIKLPETANKPNPNAGYAPYYISWNRFKYLFSPVNDTEIDDGIVIVKKENDQSDGNNGNINKVSEIMNIIYGMFKAANISISKRVKNRIARYINSACFLDMPPEKAINYAVAQNLLPKINGFYEDFKISGENNTDSKHLFTELQGLLGNIKNAIKNNQQISLDKYKEDYLKENVAKQNATEEAFEAFKKAEANNDYISYLSL